MSSLWMRMNLFIKFVMINFLDLSVILCKDLEICAHLLLCTFHYFLLRKGFGSMKFIPPPHLRHAVSCCGRVRSVGSANPTRMDSRLVTSGAGFKSRWFHFGRFMHWHANSTIAVLHQIDKRLLIVASEYAMYAACGSWCCRRLQFLPHKKSQFYSSSSFRESVAHLPFHRAQQRILFFLILCT